MARRKENFAKKDDQKSHETSSTVEVGADLVHLVVLVEIAGRLHPAHGQTDESAQREEHLALRVHDLGRAPLGVALVLAAAAAASGVVLQPHHHRERDALHLAAWRALDA